MRRIRYAVATSLDGYIAGPKGEADWIVMDPAIDFSATRRRIPLLPPPTRRAKLKLTGHRVYETGIVSLEYAVADPASGDASKSGGGR